MAVYAPDDTPPTGMDPGLWARIRNFVFPPANAAESVSSGANPAASPTPVPAALQGGGPPVPSGSGLTGGGLSSYTDLPAGVSSLAPSVDPVTGLPTRLVTSGGPVAPAMPYAGGQGPMRVSNGLLGGDLGPGGPNTIRGVDESGMPIWENDPRLPDFNKLPASSSGGGGGGRKVTVRPRAPAAAAAPVATPNDRFISMQYGTAQRGPGSTPYITALNLGNLFGGGQPAAQPVQGGALAKGSTLPKDVPLPPTMPDDLRAQRRAAAIAKAAAHSGFA